MSSGQHKLLPLIIQQRKYRGEYYNGANACKLVVAIVANYLILAIIFIRFQRPLILYRWLTNVESILGSSYSIMGTTFESQSPLRAANYVNFFITTILQDSGITFKQFPPDATYLKHKRKQRRHSTDHKDWRFSKSPKPSLDCVTHSELSMSWIYCLHSTEIYVQIRFYSSSCPMWG